MICDSLLEERDATDKEIQMEMTAEQYYTLFDL